MMLRHFQLDKCEQCPQESQPVYMCCTVCPCMHEQFRTSVNVHEGSRPASASTCALYDRRGVQP